MTELTNENIELRKTTANAIQKIMTNSGNIAFLNNAIEKFLTELKEQNKECEPAALMMTGALMGFTLADELTLHTKAFVQLAITRLSVKNSKIFATTNPADILHFIYTDWINNKKKKDIFEYLFFELVDNVNLPPEYIENIKACNSPNTSSHFC